MGHYVKAVMEDESDVDYENPEVEVQVPIIDEDGNDIDLDDKIGIQVAWMVAVFTKMKELVDLFPKSLFEDN